MSDLTKLKGVGRAGQPLTSDVLELSLVEFFNWGLLGVGAFFNATLGGSGAYGGELARLRRSEDVNYLPGQCWDGARRDWVWESGVEYTSQPVRPSGVWVDGSFHPSTGVGPYAHVVDYPNGRVIFHSPITPASGVYCEHSYRFYHFSTADVPFWRELQQESFRNDDPHFLQFASGDWSRASQSRLQMPAVVVEALPNATRVGLGLGGGDVHRQEVAFHILAETHYDRKQLHDTVVAQYQKRLIGLDKARLLDEDRLPLGASGELRDGALMYPELIAESGAGGFGWKQLRIVETRGQPGWGPRGATYTGLVRVLLEVDLP